MTTISSVSAQPASGGPSPAEPRLAPPAAKFGAVLRAMARKECRELAPIVGLIAVAYGVVLVAMLISARDVLNAHPNYSGDHSTALPDSFLMGTALMAPIAALIVGFGQFFLESRPDRLGFLTHRPAPRGTIFSAKVVTGMGLYLAALAVPLLATLWWVSDPHHVPLPFSWRMGLAPLSDILSGLPYYFAGVLVAQRTDAKWLGSRLLPIAGPVIASGLEMAAPTFAWAVLVIAIASVIVWYSARSYHVAVGQYPRVSEAGKAATGVVMVLGLITVGAAAIGLVAVMIPRNYSAYYAMEPEAGFLKDGTPVITEQAYGGPLVVKDLAGKIIQVVPASLRYTEQDLILRGNYLYSLDDTYFSRAFHQSNSYFSAGIAGPDGMRWYQSMPGTGGDYLVGYNLNTRALVGAMGANGLEEGVTAPKSRFTYPLLISEGVEGGAQPLTDRLVIRSLLSAGDSVYSISGMHTLELAFTTPNHEKIVGLGMIVVPRPGDVKADAKGDELTILLTENAMLILTAEASPKILIKYDLPHARDHWISIIPLWETGKFILQINPKTAFGINGKATIVTFNADGSIDHTIERPAIEGSRYVMSDSLGGDWIVPAIAPPVGVAAMGTLNWALSADHVFSPKMGQYMALSTGLSSLIAIATFWLARRRQMGKAAWL